MRQQPPPGGTGAGGRSDGDHPDTDEIRVEIEQTRTEMSGTIDAIQQRLAPDTLTDQAKDLARDATDQAKAAAQEVLQDAVREVKDAALEVTEHAVQEVKEAAREVTGQAKEAAWDATVGRAEDAVTNAGQTARGVGSMVIDTIKQNPIPAAIAGISIAWLYMKRPSSQGYTGGQVSGGQYRTPGSYQAPGSTTVYPPTETYPLRTGYQSSDVTRRVTDTSPPHTRVGVGSERPRQTSQAVSRKAWSAMSRARPASLRVTWRAASRAGPVR